MLDESRASFTCSFREVTLEADPETITPEKTAAWLAAGINRVSLGTQSFNDHELAASGRLHRRADICQLRGNSARRGPAKFQLRSNRPGCLTKTSDSWSNSLAELTALAPEHVSVYMLENR